MRVVVVVPTYNEVDNIVELCRAVRRQLADADILIVDDASPDGTARVVRRLGEELGGIDVLDRPGKQGLGSAYRDGMQAALDRGAEVVVQMDADLSHDPADLPALVAIVANGVDLAIGSRYVPGGATENWPRRRRWLSRWGNRYAAGVLGLAINDATAGYRAYGRDALVGMDLASMRADGYGFQIEMTHRLVRRGGRIVELPIVFRERTEGASKMSRRIVAEAALLVPRLWAGDLRGRRRRRRTFG